MASHRCQAATALSHVLYDSVSTRAILQQFSRRGSKQEGEFSPPAELRAGGEGVVVQSANAVEDRLAAKREQGDVGAIAGCDFRQQCLAAVEQCLGAVHLEA